MDVLQTKHSLWPDSSPIHMLLLNGLFCFVGTQVQMKISAGGDGASAREVQITQLRFKQEDSFLSSFLCLRCSCFLPMPSVRGTSKGVWDLEFWNCLRHRSNNSAMAIVAAQSC